MATNEKEMTVADRRELFKKRALDAVSNMDLIDLKRTGHRNYQNFTLDKIRQWQKSPFANQADLQKASQYFYRTNSNYQAVIKFYAEMFMSEMRTVVPRYELERVTAGSNSKALKGYYKSLSLLETMDVSANMIRMLINAWINDTAYGILYSDGNDSFILTLDPEYCKINGTCYDGSYCFAYDMSYFRNRQYLLEYWGEPFISMWKQYSADTTHRWIPVDPKIGIVIKVNTNDPLLSLPPFSSLFQPLLLLGNLEDIQNTKDELSIYKILCLTLETFTSSNVPDDFRVDPDTAQRYLKKIEGQLPESIGVMLNPGLKAEILDVMNDDTGETDRISEANKNIFQRSGTHFMDSENLTSSTAWKILMRFATRMGLATTLPQIQAFINRWLLNEVGVNAAKVIFHLVSPYTMDDFVDGIRQSATLGLPNRLLLNNANGITELDTLRMNRLEIDALDLNDAFVPMKTSYTQANDDGVYNPEGGAPTKDDGELTDAGERNRVEVDRIG